MLSMRSQEGVYLTTLTLRMSVELVRSDMRARELTRLSQSPAQNHSLTSCVQHPIVRAVRALPASVKEEFKPPCTAGA